MNRVFDIALVFSAHEWVESLHRFATNTGKLRIRSLVYDSSILSTEDFDACIISDTHPSLSKSLVNSIHSKNRIVFGVCDDSNESREYLASIGIDAVLSSRLSSEDLAKQISDFIEKQTSLADSNNFPIAVDEHPSENLQIENTSTSKIAIVGTSGSGATEFACAISRRLIDSVLIDFDFEHPSIGPRLGLQIEPNLITAFESTAGNDIDTPVPIQRTNKHSVIVGSIHPSFAKGIHQSEVLRLIDILENQYTNLIFDLGRVSEYSFFWSLQKLVIQHCNQIIIIGDSTPVGVLRVLEMVASLSAINQEFDTETKINAVFNKTNKNKNIESQIKQELRDISQISSIYFLPFSKDLPLLNWQAKQECPNSWKKIIEKILEQTQNKPQKTLEIHEELPHSNENYMSSIEVKV